MSDDVIDKLIGKRLILARSRCDKPLQGVAEELGVSYQQLRKYELGVNRISASSLFRLAAILAVPPAFFFEGLTSALPGRAAQTEIHMDGAATGQVVEAISRINDDEIRERLRDLIQVLGTSLPRA